MIVKFKNTFRSKINTLVYNFKNIQFTMNDVIEVCTFIVVFSLIWFSKYLSDNKLLNYIIVLFMNFIYLFTDIYVVNSSSILIKVKKSKIKMLIYLTSLIIFITFVEVKVSDMVDTTVNVIQSHSTRRTSTKMINQIKKFESYIPNAIWDYKGWSYGYGHTHKSVKQNEYISKSDAEILLKKDLVKCENSVNESFKDFNLTQNEFDALVSFSYNVGVNIFNESVGFKTIKTTKRKQDIPYVMKQYNKVTKDGKLVLNQGLVKRRSIEIKIFKTNKYE